MRAPHRILLATLTILFVVSVVVVVICISVVSTRWAKSASSTLQADVTPSLTVTSSMTPNPQDESDDNEDFMPSEEINPSGKKDDVQKHMSTIAPSSGKSKDDKSGFPPTSPAPDPSGFPATTISPPAAGDPQKECQQLAKNLHTAIQTLREDVNQSLEKQQEVSSMVSRQDLQVALTNSTSGVLSSLTQVLTRVEETEDDHRELSSTILNSTDRILAALARLESREATCGNKCSEFLSDLRDLAGGLNRPSPDSSGAEAPLCPPGDVAIRFERLTDRVLTSISRLDAKLDGSAIQGTASPDVDVQHWPPVDQLQILFKDAVQDVGNTLLAELEKRERTDQGGTPDFSEQLNSTHEKMSALSNQLTALRFAADVEAEQTRSLKTTVTNLGAVLQALQREVTSLSGAVQSSRDASGQQVSQVKQQVVYMASSFSSILTQLLTILVRAGVAFLKGLPDILRRMNIIPWPVSTFSSVISLLEGNYVKALSVVRLVDGSSPKEGRVEVYHKGQWGTVCDDAFESEDAAAVCRILGFTGSATALGSAAFGQGSGPIWLDDVSCSSSAQTLAECGHSGWGTHNCQHSEDVGVRCS